MVNSLPETFTLQALYTTWASKSPLGSVSTIKVCPRVAHHSHSDENVSP